MRLSLKTKFTLATSVLVFAVVAVVSWLYIARLTKQTLRQAARGANFVGQQMLTACRSAISEANERGDLAPKDPSELRGYIQRSFDNSSTLNSLMESDIGFDPSIIEIAITDNDGVIITSSDASLRGQKVPAHPSISSLVNVGFFQQLRELFGPPQTYEDSLPFNLGQSPFGSVRIALSSAFMRDQIQPSLRSAAYWALGSVLL